MIFTFVPVIWMVLTAFKSSAEMYQSAAFLPKDMSLSTLIGRVTEAWVKLDLGRSIIQTLILTVGHVFFGIVFPGIAGYILSKHKVAGTKLVFSSLLNQVICLFAYLLVCIFIFSSHFVLIFCLNSF